MVLANVFSAKVLNIFPVPYFIVVVAFPTALLLFLLIFLSFPGSIRESTGFKFIKLKAFAGEEALRARALRARALARTCSTARRRDTKHKWYLFANTHLR